MRRAMGLSLVGHLVVLVGLALGADREPVLPPVAVYSVQLVGAAEAMPAPAPPKARSGVKTPAPPSREKSAPRGVKKPVAPARPAAGKASAAKAETGKAATAKTAASAAAGMRLEGEPFPFPEYLRDLLQRVQERWERPLVPAGGHKATVFFTILRDGRIAACRVESGSGLLAFDRSALEAVLAAAPLPPLPEGFSGSQLGVHLDFSE